MTNDRAERHKRLFSEIPRLPDGKPDVPAATQFLNERFFHAHRSRSDVRKIAMGLGMDGRDAARLAAASQENASTLINYIIEQMAAGTTLGGVTAPQQPPATTDHNERIRLMQHCRKLEQTLGLTNPKEMDWYTNSTVPQLNEYKEYLDALQSEPAVAPTTPAPAQPTQTTPPAAPTAQPVAEVVLQQPPAQQTPVPPPPVPVTETQSAVEAQSFVSPSGYVIPESVRGNTAIVTQLLNLSCMTSAEISKASGSGELSKIVRKNGLNLSMPDGSKLPRGSNKAKFIEALVAHFHPNGHVTYAPERLGATDWAAREYGNAQPKPEQAPVQAVAPAEEPPLPPEVQNHMNSIREERREAVVANTAAPDAPVVDNGDHLPITHPIAQTTGMDHETLLRQMIPQNDRELQEEIWMMLKSKEQREARIELKLDEIINALGSIDLVVASTARHFNPNNPEHTSCQDLISSNQLHMRVNNGS